MRFMKVRFTLLSMMALLILGLFFAGCSQDSGLNPSDTGQNVITSGSTLSTTSTDKSLGGFAVEAKFSHIHSYPTGSGIFILRLVPDEGFTGTVGLSLKANSRLDAALLSNTLTVENPVTEITVHPSMAVEFLTHVIEVKATSGGVTQILPLEVEIIGWSSWGSGYAEQKLAEFYDWLQTEHPELGDLVNRTWETYATYPGILIVEHWSFVDAEYELRLCFHVMIPPYDWSKILIRKRGEWDPILAA